MNGRTPDVRRRRLIMAIMGTPVLGATLMACTATSDGKRPPPGPAPDADAQVRLRAALAEQDLLALHAAVIAGHGDLQDLLAPLTAHHRRHLKAVLDDGPLPVLNTLGVTITSEGSGDDAPQVNLDAVRLPEVPGDPAAALTAVREAELAASEAHVAECLLAGGSRLAALLGSMAAAEAAHDATLEAA